MPIISAIPSVRIMLSQIGRPQFWMNSATRMPPNPTMEPIDKSIPPVRIVKLTPIAAIPRIALSRVVTLRLSSERKRGLSTKPIASSATSTRKSTSSFARKRAVKDVANPREYRASSGDFVAELRMWLFSHGAFGLGTIDIGRRSHIKGQELGSAGHNLLLRQFVTRKFAGHAPLAKHNHAIAHADDFGHLRRDHHNRHALLRQLAHQRMNLGLGAHVDTAGRLIENQNLGFGCQPLGQNNLLLI